MIMIKPVYEVLLQVQKLKSITLWQHKIHIHHKPFEKLYSFSHKPCKGRLTEADTPTIGWAPLHPD